MSDTGAAKSTPILRWFESDNFFIALDQTSAKTAESAESPEQSQSQESVTDLHDAVLLAEHEPLLQCLAALLGADVAWQPVREPAAALHEMSHMPRITATLRSLQGAEQCVYLAIPVDDLDTVPEIPEQWQSLVKFEPHVFHFHPCLQSCVLTDQESDKLVPGSMALIEGSFNDNWPVSLVFQSDSANTSVRVDEYFKVLLDRDNQSCLLYTSPSPRDGLLSRMPSSA